MPRSQNGNHLIKGFVLALVTILFVSFTRPATDRVIAEIPEQINRADILFDRGIEEYKAKQIAASIASWQEALTIYQNNFYRLELLNFSPKKNEKESELLRKKATILSNLAAAYYTLEKYGKAIDYYQRRANISRQLNDRYGEAKSFNGMGRIYYVLGKYPQAIGLYQRSLAIAKEIEIAQGEGITLNNLGDVYIALTDYDKGIDRYEQSILIARRIGDLALESQSLENLGIAYKKRQDIQKAIEYFESSLKLAKAIESLQRERAILNNLGIAYYQLGQFNKAIGYHQKSRTNAAALGAKKEEAKSLNFLGSCYYALGDYTTATAYYNRSLVIAKEIDAKQEQTKALNNLGTVYSTLGEPQKAVSYYQQSLAIAEIIKDRKQQVKILGNLGIAYGALAEYQKGVECYRKQLILVRKIGSKAKEQQVAIDLGKTYLALENYVGVIDTYEQIINFSKLPDERQQAIVLGTLGNAYLALGNDRRAIEYLRPYLTITERIKDLHGQKIALNHLGLALYNTGNLTEAESLLRQRITLAENQQESLKFTAFERQALPYNTLQKTLIAENKTQEALVFAERAKKRDLIDLLGEQNFPDLAKKLSLDEIKTIAKTTKATLVVYSLPSSDRLYIWVIKPSEKIIFSEVKIPNYGNKKDVGRLSDLIDRALAEISLNATAEIQKKPEPTLREIYKILIAPIADLLPQNPEEEVIFIPQKELFLVPFAALKDGREKYLIERHSLAKIPSIEMLELVERNSQKQKKVSQPLIVGNSKETAAIAKILNAKKLDNSQADETTIKQKMSQAQLIYLTTDRLLDNNITSAIALAASETDDGWLTAREILKLKLNARLVVIDVSNLSPDRIRNNTIISLSSALINAGVERVIFSLRSTEEATNGEITSEFYTQWFKNGRAAQSLRQAILKEIKANSQLKNWSAFSLIGS